MPTKARKFTKTQTEVLCLCWTNRPGNTPLAGRSQKVSADALHQLGLVKKHTPSGGFGSFASSYFYSLTDKGEYEARKLAEAGAFVARWAVTLERLDAEGVWRKAYSTMRWGKGAAEATAKEDAKAAGLFDQDTYRFTAELA